MRVPPEASAATERTALAYWRTILASVVVAMLVVRQAHGRAETWASAVVAAAAVAVIAAVGYRRQRALLHGGTRAAPRVVTALVAALVTLQVVSVVVVL